MSEPVTPPPVAPAPGGDLASMGLRVPWLGAAIGGLGAAGYDAYRNGTGNWRRSLRKGLTGAATGVGAELGLGLGGELARRHSVAGGGFESAALTPLISGAAGAGAGYLLSRERDDEGDE